METDDVKDKRDPEGATAEPYEAGTETGVEADPSENPNPETTGGADEDEPRGSGRSGSGLDEDEEEKEDDEEEGDGDEDGDDEDDDDEEDDEYGEDEDEEDLDQPSILLKIGKQKGKGNWAVGKYIKKKVIKKSREDEPIVAKLGRITIARLRGVFARPDGYEKAINLESIRKRRIIAVHGPKRSGKLTCAVNLACDLWREAERPPKIYLYKRGADETRSLREAIQSKRIKQGTVVILENVFESNVARRELEPPELSDLEEVLKDKECRLLLTTKVEDSGSFLLARVSARVRDLKRVLEAHLKYLRKQENWALGDEIVKGVLAKWPALKSTLHNPAQIERFCRRLAEQPPRNVEEIEKLAEQAAVAGRRALQEWFGGLRSNEKLLAMLVYLFGGERQPLEELYRKSVYGLRAEGFIWLDDPRQMGFSDMLEAIEVRDLGGLIEFKDAEFEEEAAAQVESWAHLIWSVVDPLVKDVKPGEDWDSWQPRRGLGNALGRMSLHGRKSFVSAVERLAGQGWDKAAVVAGYALEETVRRDFEAQRKLVLEKLRSWIDSRRPSLMWAAGASLARVYAATSGEVASQEVLRAFQNHLIALLRRLIKRSASFSEEMAADLKHKLGRANRICAWGTARRIFLLDSGRAPLLGEWLQEDNEFLTEVAREALMLIFGSLTEPRYKPGEAKHRPFLDLVEPVLAAAGRGKHDRLLVEQVFLAVKSWLRWESWHGPIFQALLDVANRGSSGVRAKLRSALSRLWLHRGANRESEEAFKIAQAVIARAYAMDGALMDRPRFGRCVFVLDPTFLSGDEEARDRKKKETLDRKEKEAQDRKEKEVRDRKEKVYRHLIGLLEAQVDVSAVHLGARDAVQLTDQSPLLLATDYSVPPLVMPALEAAWTADTRLVLVLTARRLWDLEDVAGQPWAKDFFVVAAGDEMGEHEGVQIIPIGKDPKPEEVEKVERALQTRWARALAQAGPWDWWGVLRSFDLGEEIEEGPRPWLGRLVGGLGDIGLATGHGDLARKILCIFGWYASRDLRACAQLLQSWLEKEAPPFQQWMGAAGARVLFAIHSAETPSPEDSAPEILFEELAAPLADQSKDGSEAVLRTVRRWIEEPFWAEYLAGDVVEGRGRLLRWAERFAPQHAGELRRLLPEVKEMPAAPFREESLAAMLERIQLRPVLGVPRVLPKLDEGERYALIVLDMSDLSASKAANLDSVAIDLFRSLNGRNGHSLKPVIYRLGERRPVWAAGAPPPPRDVLLVPEAPRQPRLLGPILMDPGLAERTQLVLVLTARPLLDAEDWLETEWRDRIVFYQPGADGERHPGFAAVPALNGESMGVAIARFLLRGAADEDAASAAA